MAVASAFAPTSSVLEEMGERYRTPINEALSAQLDIFSSIVSDAFRHQFDELGEVITTMATSEMAKLDLAPLRSQLATAFDNLDLSPLRDALSAVDVGQMAGLSSAAGPMPAIVDAVAAADGEQVQTMLVVAGLVVVYLMAVVGSASFWLVVPSEDRVEILGAISALVGSLISLEQLASRRSAN